jgi:Ca-activated chloride channel family protein
MDRRLLLTAPLASLALAGAWLAPRFWQHVPAPSAVVFASPPTTVSTGGLTFRAEVDRTLTDPLSREVRVHVTLSGDARPDDVHVPTDLVVVLDRSGSMSGQKIADARAATAALIRQLHPEDRVALVSFGSEARVDLPLAHPKEGTWEAVVAGLRDGGSTDLQEGLLVAQAAAYVSPGRATRMVVLSDGHPDQTWEQLTSLVSAIAAHDVPVTAVGIGEDWDESLMRRLADAGTGNLHWVQQGPALQKVLAGELDSAARVVAQAATLRVDGPATVLGAAGYSTEGGQVRVGAVTAGHERGLWLTLRLAGNEPGVVDPGEVVLSVRTADGGLEERRIDLPPITVSPDAAVAFASLGDEWAHGVVQESWNEARQQASERVQRGDGDGALAVLQGYQQRFAATNSYANNPIVGDNLTQAAALEADLRAVLSTQDAGLRNTWSKGNLVDATTQRKR